QLRQSDNVEAKDNVHDESQEGFYTVQHGLLRWDEAGSKSANSTGECCDKPHCGLQSLEDLQLKSRLINECTRGPCCVGKPNFVFKTIGHVWHCGMQIRVFLENCL